MKLSHFMLPAVVIFSSLTPGQASALTVNQFFQICETARVECSEHPVLQAYVGGALDLIAMLDEETDYLTRVYCERTAKLFDVPSIIRYMEIQRAAHADKNAMLVLIRYLEERGGC